MITISPLNINYSGPKVYNEDVFRYAIRSFSFLLDNGKHTLSRLAYEIRDHYSLDDDRTLAVVACLEAESIWTKYLNREAFPAMAQHSPHVHNNSGTHSTTTGMDHKREFLIRCPLCSDCHTKFSGDVDFMHAELYRQYWVILQHMQKEHGDQL